MRRFTPSALIGVTTLGVVFGLLAAQSDLSRSVMASVSPALPVKVSQQVHVGTAPAKAMSAEEWAAKLDAINWQNPDAAVLDALRPALGSNSGLRDKLVQRYRSATDPMAKARMRQAIATIAAPDVVALALTMAKAADAGARADGFGLLAEFPPTEEAYALAKFALTHEAEPHALAAAVLALRPALIPPIGEERVVMPQLLALVQHPSPMVRAYSVQKVAEWERLGQAAAGTTLRALTDSESIVRQAGVGAVMIGAFRTNDIKLALMKIVRNSDEGVDIRGPALNALTRFALTDAERAVYLAVSDELMRKYGPGVN